jgi:hypothetical protein
MSVPVSSIEELKSQASQIQCQIGNLTKKLMDISNQIRKLESPEALSKALQLPHIVKEWLSKKNLDFKFGCDSLGKYAHLSEVLTFYSPAGELEYCLSQSKQEGCSASIRVTSKVGSSRQMETQVAFASGLLKGNANQLTEDDWKDLIISGNPIAMIFVLAINRFRDL